MEDSLYQITFVNDGIDVLRTWGWESGWIHKACAQELSAYCFFTVLIFLPMQWFFGRKE